MNYLLVEDRTIVHLDMPWQPRRFQREIADLEIQTTFVAVAAEPGYVKLSDKFELIPVTVDAPPIYNPLYEHLVGPTIVYSAESAEKTYGKEFNDLDNIKLELKNKLAAARYIKENAGVKVTIQGTEVTVDTSRDIRNIFIQKYFLMGAEEVSNWKFDNVWLSISKPELETLIFAGAAHIQAQFDWEKQTGIDIDAATTADALQLIEQTINPVTVQPQGPENGGI